jgi:hypothetical protein
LNFLVIFMQRIYNYYLKFFDESKSKVDELNKFLKIDFERKIEGLSILFKLDRGHAKSWTKVMRLFLTNIKLLLLYQTKKEEIELLAFLD